MDHRLTSTDKCANRLLSYLGKHRRQEECRRDTFAKPQEYNLEKAISGRMGDVTHGPNAYAQGHAQCTGTRWEVFVHLDLTDQKRAA